MYEDLIKEIKTVKKTFEGEAKMSDTLFVTFKNGKVWHVPHDPDNIDYDPGKTKETGKYTPKFMIENER